MSTAYYCQLLIIVLFVNICILIRSRALFSQLSLNYNACLYGPDWLTVFSDPLFEWIYKTRVKLRFEDEKTQPQTRFKERGIFQVKSSFKSRSGRG